MKPRSLIVTLFGDFIQYYGGDIWVGSLIQLMANFGMSESSVRGAILRMVQQELLVAKRIGNKSYYRLTDQGKRRIEEGVRRVYTIKNHKWDGLWRILTYSVPEEKRELRNQLRKELSWTGFGLISNSTWVSPNPLEEQTMEMIRNYQLEEYTTLFTAGSIVSHDQQYLVNKGWNLPAIQAEYDTFIDTYRPKYEQLKERVWNNSLTDQEAFVERTRLVHAYRKFLFQDPGFPQELLPKDWNGTGARELFWNIHQLISPPAVRYFESLFEHSPDTQLIDSRQRAINPFAEFNS
ncbi:phenylacetic acid degradation operon negative regulatory protein PaaX [Brevibacillus fulvus]|uniref:Phenylacetic acid degradation operon negative regulatory protein n=1 Tax=Brevibacillus fulvus TaxID=1125967 RepID=A0A939BT64_9BACL|nr:phenylacetic acid degradation operon negative regulatory protein PaaX [Brevibacillus fulvus]MBM7589159.1 phenylacetic acid degradation operon negative regulatory protein [Brevibacillus fulvus]